MSMTIRDVFEEVNSARALQQRHAIVRVRVSTDAFRYSMAVMRITPERARLDGLPETARELVIHPEDWKAVKRLIPIAGCPVVDITDHGHRMLGVPVVIE